MIENRDDRQRSRKEIKPHKRLKGTLFNRDFGLFRVYSALPLAQGAFKTQVRPPQGRSCVFVFLCTLCCPNGIFSRWKIWVASTFQNSRKGLPNLPALHKKKSANSHDLTDHFHFR